MTTLDHLIDEDARAMVPTSRRASRTETAVICLVLLITGTFFAWALWGAMSA